MQWNARKIKSLKLDVCIDPYKKILFGFVLIELLITIVISSLLLNLLMKIYLTSEKVMQWQAALNKIQNNANDVNLILNSEVKKAGHIGCAKLTSEFSVTPYHEYSLNIKNKLTGNDHELTIRYADYPTANLVQTMNDQTHLNVSRNIKFTSGDIVLISNCKWAEIFQVAKVKVSHEVQEIISSSQLKHYFELNSEISRYEVNHYYIHKTNRTHRDGSYVYALFVDNNYQHKTELVSDVTNLDLKYTVYQQGKLVDVMASQIKDWANVQGVAYDTQLVSSPFKKIWYGYAALSK